jgi:hypothetical protein
VKEPDVADDRCDAPPYSCCVPVTVPRLVEDAVEQVVRIHVYQTLERVVVVQPLAALEERRLVLPVDRLLVVAHRLDQKGRVLAAQVLAVREPVAEVAELAQNAVADRVNRLERRHVQPQGIADDIEPEVPDRKRRVARVLPHLLDHLRGLVRDRRLPHHENFLKLEHQVVVGDRQLPVVGDLRDAAAEKLQLRRIERKHQRRRQPHLVHRPRIDDEVQERKVEKHVAVPRDTDPQPNQNVLRSPDAQLLEVHPLLRLARPLARLDKRRIVQASRNPAALRLEERHRPADRTRQNNENNHPRHRRRQIDPERPDQCQKLPNDAGDRNASDDRVHPEPLERKVPKPVQSIGAHEKTKQNRPRRDPILERVENRAE